MRASVCERESKQVNKKVNGQKSSPPNPRALFIGRRMVVVYIYFIGGAEYYKKFIGFIKKSLELINRSLNTTTKSLDLMNKPSYPYF